MFKVRVSFAKAAPACYISHLDLMKTLQRGLCRAKLPVRYSEGFNPHIYLSILAPLSTGYESRCDLMDFDLIEELPYDHISARLDAVLPAGLTVLGAGPVGGSAGDIAWSSFEILYPGHHHTEAMTTLFDGPLLLNKRSKRGAKEVDITQYLQEKPVFARDGQNTLCRVTLALGTDPLNPLYITQVLTDHNLISADIVPRYIRTALLDKNGELFR